MSNSNNSLLTFEAIIESYNRAYIAQEEAKEAYLIASKVGDEHGKKAALVAFAEAGMSFVKSKADMEELVAQGDKAQHV